MKTALALIVLTMSCAVAAMLPSAEHVKDRRAIHGKILRQSVDMKSLVKTTYFEDGTVFVDQPKHIRPIDSVKAANAKRKPPAMTNGIPARLAAARLRQRENSTATNQVTIVIKAGE